MEKKNLITSKEKGILENNENKYFEIFLERFLKKKKRPLEYKTLRLLSLKDNEYISQEEFIKAKEKLVKQGE